MSQTVEPAGEHALRCMEIWGGSHAVENAVATPGLYLAWLDGDELDGTWEVPAYGMSWRFTLERSGSRAARARGGPP